MATLKSRQLQIPNGFKFVQPETGWQAPRFASFQIIVDALVAHRNANPGLAAKHKWSLNPRDVANEVEQFNVRICQTMGWGNYISSAAGEPPPPKPRPPSPQEQSEVVVAGAKVAKIWAGVKTLNDWLDSNTPPVPQEQSTARAAVCAGCPKNGKGDFSKWFTMPASEAIRRQMEKLNERKLTTPHDASIQVCEVCYCPLKLKVHTPLPYIKNHLKKEVQQELRDVQPTCWIISELDA